MATIYMESDSGIFSSHGRARPTPAPRGDATAHTRPVTAPMDPRRAASSSAAIQYVREAGATARGKPPPVSTRFVVGLQWAMFAACALRILVFAP